jgi:hypothetical protein
MERSTEKMELLGAEDVAELLGSRRPRCGAGAARDVCRA